jgi:hypothetical protein
MAQNVIFVRTTKEKQINREKYNPNALYFCTDSREFYRADQLLTDGVRVVATYDDLPSFNVAADGILYFVENTQNGYVLNVARNGWLQVIYAPTGGGSASTEEVIVAVKEEILKTVYTKEEIDNLIPDDVASINFAGVEMTKADGVFSIDREAALDALGIDAPVSEDGETVVIATTTTVAEMSEDLKTYVDEQIKQVETPTETIDYGEI